MEENSIHAFRELVIAARNSGINILKKNVVGDRVKKPFPDAKALFDLIDSLSIEQKSLLINGLPYILDLSFFKFLYLLETTESPNRIELFSIAKDGESTPLIAKEIDLELRTKYWNWIAAEN